MELSDNSDPEIFKKIEKSLFGRVGNYVYLPQKLGFILSRY